METLLSIDSEITIWLNQWVGRWAALDNVAELMVGDYFIPVVLSLTLLAFWFFGNNASERIANQKAVVAALLGVGFSNLTVLILNQLYFRDRPFVGHDLNLLFYQPTDSSFPANPVAVAFAISAGVFQRNRPLGSALGGLAALWGVSRVYAGVFHPSDVLAGAIVGVAMAYLFAMLLRKIEPLPTWVLDIARRFYLA